MEIDEFVRKTLESVVKGVLDARNSEFGSGIAADFYSAQHSGLHLYVATGDRLAYPVNFDVAVTVTENSGKTGGAKISVLSMGLGGEMKSSSEETVVSRISFVVPIACPRIEKVHTTTMQPPPENKWVV